MAEGHTNPIVNLCNLNHYGESRLGNFFFLPDNFSLFLFFFLESSQFRVWAQRLVATLPQKENRPLWLGREEGGGELRKPYRDMRDRSVSAYFRYHHGRRIEIVNELAVLQAKRSNETNGDICPSRKPAEFFPKRVKQPCTAARRRGDISNLGNFPNQ